MVGAHVRIGSVLRHRLEGLSVLMPGDEDLDLPILARGVLQIKVKVSMIGEIQWRRIGWPVR